MHSNSKPISETSSTIAVDLSNILTQLWEVRVGGDGRRVAILEWDAALNLVEELKERGVEQLHLDRADDFKTL